MGHMTSDVFDPTRWELDAGALHTWTQVPCGSHFSGRGGCSLGDSTRSLSPTDLLHKLVQGLRHFVLRSFYHVLQAGQG